jgi:RNA polymerase sigma-70 factor (ECF subfamily)
VSVHDQSDEDLVRRFTQGDALAFDELVLRHRDVVYRFVRSQLEVGRSDAEDVTQNVLIEVYRCLDRFEGRSRLRTWILGVAANVCRQRRRARFSAVGRLEIDIGAEALRQLPDGSPGLESVLERRGLQKAVREAIDSLGSDHRAIVVLRDIEGLSYAEIAAVLQLPLGTVRSRLHNARASLAERLMPLARMEGS